jgi:hypothetical protein
MSGTEEQSGIASAMTNADGSANSMRKKIVLGGLPDCSRDKA